MPPGPGRRMRLSKARAVLVLLCAGALAGGTALASTILAHRAATPSTGVALRSPNTSPGAVAPPPLDDGAPAVPPVQALPVSGGPGRVVDVPILMYHYIRLDQKPGDTVGFNLSVTPQNFVLQMALLKASGFHTVTVHQVVAAMEGKATLPSHPIVLTFDDGYADFATRAAPTMARFGLSGTTYVVSGFVGKQGYMTLQQLHQVIAMGMTVGAHTVHHVDLASLPAAAARSEIDMSRETLIAMTGQPVLDFAYPYGAVSAPVVAEVQQAGFDDAVTTQDGSVHFLAQRFVLTRVRVSGGESLRTFAEHLGMGPGFPGFGFGLLGAAFGPTPPPTTAVAARMDGPVAS